MALMAYAGGIKEIVGGLAKQDDYYFCIVDKWFLDDTGFACVEGLREMTALEPHHTIVIPEELL